MTDTSKRYHHGDLRRSMIETALEMLTEEGGWQFTLRELARRSGVSHTASYKHFPDKAALLGELAAIGFERLREALVEAGAGPAPGPRGVFLETSRAYVRFGAANPNLYRLMFSADAPKATDARLKDRGEAALRVLIDMISEGQREGWLRVRDVRGQAGAVWAQLHGVTLLTIDGRFGPEIVGPEGGEAALETLLEGLEAKVN